MFSQLLINSLSAASVYILIGLGFGLVYSIARFFHFAHAAIFIICPYIALFIFSWFKSPLYIAIPLAIILVTLLGCLIDIFVYSPLRKKGSSPLILLLASFGVYIVLQNLISMIFGDDTKSLLVGVVQKGILFMGARITLIQLISIITSCFFLIALWAFMKKTKIGLALRAVSDDAELSSVVGLNSDKLILVTFAIGSALAGIGGILFALDINMTPTIGMNALMMGIIAVIVGGVGSIPGVALGALLLGMAQHFGVWKISSQWQDVIAFVILFIFLIFKPEGFLGRK